MSNSRGRRTFATFVVLLALSAAAVVAAPVIESWLRFAAHAVSIGEPDGTWPLPIETEPHWSEDAPGLEQPAGQEGSGWHVAPGGTGRVGVGRLYRYRVEVEAGSGLSTAEVARVVDNALRDPRGWSNEVAFQRVEAGDVEMVIRVASPATVDRLCAPMDTNGEVSCTNGNLVVLNLVRWNHGVKAYADAVADYRVLVVNHEVGHRIGHSGHPPCPGPGRPSPVMMQVYYTGLQGCVRNIWPYTTDGAFIG